MLSALYSLSQYLMTRDQGSRESRQLSNKPPYFYAVAVFYPFVNAMMI